MTRKYEKEYRKYLLSLNLWIKRTNERLEMLPQIEKLSELTYEQWCELFKDNSQSKILPSPPSPPPPRIINEGRKPPKPPPSEITK